MEEPWRLSRAWEAGEPVFRNAPRKARHSGCSHNGSTIARHSPPSVICQSAGGLPWRPRPCRHRSRHRHAAPPQAAAMPERALRNPGSPLNLLLSSTVEGQRSPVSPSSATSACPGSILRRRKRQTPCPIRKSRAEKILFSGGGEWLSAGRSTPPRICPGLIFSTCPSGDRCRTF